jgi:hypothetical protein
MTALHDTEAPACLTPARPLRCNIGTFMRFFCLRPLIGALPTGECSGQSPTRALRQRCFGPNQGPQGIPCAINRGPDYEKRSNRAEQRIVAG